MRTSDALDLEKGVFTKSSPRAIARSLKRSAMSMLVFHLNRGGKQLPAAQRKRLEQAKDELRQLCGRKPRQARSHRHP
jgi:hypothetical protein